MTVTPLLLAAHGETARVWNDAIHRSRAFELRAAIDLSAGEAELDAALAHHPGAAVFALARGPLDASRLCTRLLAHDGPSLVHPPPFRPPSGRGLQLSYGWLSLAGADALVRHFEAAPPELVRFRVRGVPDGIDAGLSSALHHALALAKRFGPIRLVDALLENERELRLSLTVGAVLWRMEIAADRAPELHLVARTPTGDFTWRADAHTESLERTGAEPRALTIPTLAERCVRQLERPVAGADLADANDLRALVDAVELHLERRLPPSPSGTARSQSQGLLALGLKGTLPDAPSLPATPPPRSPELPLAVLAYRLGLRPAAELIVDADDEAHTSELLPGTVERRALGGRVALFAAMAPEHARELAAIHPNGAEPRAASRAGALLGYPACCVQAFIAQVEPPSESYARYAIAARTAVGPGPWPALLDDTSLALLPHRPCTYRCERSREQARAFLAALARQDRALHDALTDYLGGPVLYFDQDHQLRFRGAYRDGGINYDEVALPWCGSEDFARLAGVIAAGNRLVLDEATLVVEADGEPLVMLERTDPGLGIILPFH